MTAPYLNTQSFKLAVVLEGEGEVQIVCPHLARDSERREHEHGKGRRSEEEDDDLASPPDPTSKRPRSSVPPLLTWISESVFHIICFPPPKAHVVSSSAWNTFSF